MPNQINLWPHLPGEIQDEIIKRADSIGAETIYIWRTLYYARRNSYILNQYRQLRTSTNKSNKEIYEQIAREVSYFFGKTSVKAVEHVISRYSPQTQ